jgi:hypothetical protein
MPRTELEREADLMQQRRAAGQPTPGYVRGTIENGRFFIEDDAGKREVSAEEYAQARSAPRAAYDAPVPGLERRRMTPEERRKSAFSELDGMKKGGKVKVSGHTKKGRIRGYD